MTLSAFNDELGQVRTRKKEFLSQIERLIPWSEWIALIQPCYYKGELGNKPYGLELMLRIYLLQNLYDMSDEKTRGVGYPRQIFPQITEFFHREQQK